MKSNHIVSLVVLAALLSISMAASAQSLPAVQPGNAGTFLTFDAPGAGTGPHQGTIPFTLNPRGTITMRSLPEWRSRYFHLMMRGSPEIAMVCSSTPRD